MGGQLEKVGILTFSVVNFYILCCCFYSSVPAMTSLVLAISKRKIKEKYLKYSLLETLWLIIINHNVSNKEYFKYSNINIVIVI